MNKEELRRDLERYVEEWQEEEGNGQSLAERYILPKISPEDFEKVIQGGVLDVDKFNIPEMLVAIRAWREFRREHVKFFLAAGKVAKQATEEKKIHQAEVKRIPERWVVVIHTSTGSFTIETVGETEAKELTRVFNKVVR